MTRTWSPICISVLVLLPVACTNAGHERPITSSWEATIEHQAIREAVGVAVIGEVLFVSDPESGAIHRFRFDGWSRIESTGSWSSQANRPMHLSSVAGQQLVVPDYLSDEIVLLEANSSVVLRFGEPGTGPGQFDAPAAAAVGPGWAILVADFNNHRIQRFNANGEFERLWGQKGHEPGQFYYPTDVAVAPDGRVYVADAYNHRIQ